MSKMGELYAQKELIDQLENNEDKLVIEIKYEDCEETGYRKYNFDEMTTEFDEKIKELETDVEMRQEAWNEKQQDYAMDNMTCDEIDEERDNV
tara:strand:+ start:260 stop:538 length:279 start_codon:yes stop_codon:yes gene_type:complete